MVDASYKFIYVDVGCNGQIFDGGVFKNCTLYQELDEKALNLPKPSLLPGSTIASPYVIAHCCLALLLLHHMLLQQMMHLL